MVPLKKTAREDIQYTQFNDIDNSLLWGTSSTVDDDIPQYNTALRSVVRRRHPIVNISPVAVISLVGLKNLFYRQTLTPVARRPTQSFYHYNNEQIATNDSTTDLESLSIDSKNDKVNQSKGFKIDARVISDATIGLSDGLTVPFALTAGLSALGNTKVVIYGGFAELIAGAISMGLGGYLGAKSEAASYKALKEKTQHLVATNPQTVIQKVSEVFAPYNVPKATLDDLTRHLADSPRLVDFVMQFQHCEEEPASFRATNSALTIAIAYFFGGLLPLIPYLCVGDKEVYKGLYISIGVMVLALFTFGYTKTGIIIGWRGGNNIKSACWGGIQMVVVGSAAAGCAMGLVRAFNHDEHTDLDIL